MTELSRRILTAFVLAPIVILVVLVLPPLGFAAFALIFVTLAALEWTTLMGLSKKNLRFLYVFFIVCLSGVLYWLTFFQMYWFSMPILLLLTFGWWLFALCWIIQANRQGIHQVHHPLQEGLIGILILMLSWVGLNFLRLQPSGSAWILVLFFLIWGADAAAYFGGRHFGKRKLAKGVSPGKTIEGVYSALAAGIFVCVVAGFWFRLSPLKFFLLIILGMVTLLISIVGDLFLSLMKRRRSLKDTGHLLPGHGGILDRIDSLLAASPVFALMLFYLRIS